MNGQFLKLLLVANASDAETVIKYLAAAGFAVQSHRELTSAAAQEALSLDNWDLLICDYDQADLASEPFEQLKNDAQLPILILSAHRDESRAVRALDAGAQDCLYRDDLRRLGGVVRRELSRAHPERTGQPTEQTMQEARYRHIVAHAADAIVSCDASQKIMIFNRGAEEMFGYQSDEVLGKPLDILIPQRFRERHRQQVETFGQGSPQSKDLGDRSHIRGLRRSGEEFPAAASITRWDEIDGPVYTAFLRDRSHGDQRDRESRLLQHAALALNEATDTTAALDSVLQDICSNTRWLLGQAWLPDDQGYLRCNPAWYARDPGLEPFRAVSLNTRFTFGEGIPGRVWSSGQPLWVRDVTRAGHFKRLEIAQEVGICAAMAVPVLSAGTTVAVLEFFMDRCLQEDRAHMECIAAVASQLGNALQRRRAEERAQHLAQHDLLTGLPNRSLFEDRLAMAVAEAHRHQHRVAILFLDLDRFKMVNESFGHDAGDALLKVMAERLGHCLEKGDTLARLSADEFGILLLGITDFEEVLQATQKIQRAVRRPFEWQNQEIFCTASIGVAFYPDPELKTTDRPRSATELIRKTDTALLRAKENGGDGYDFYHQEMTERAIEHLTLSSALNQAVSREQFDLHYQPQIDLTTGNVISVEALIRWTHPERGLIQPDQFIPVAEASGVILPIGEWVLRTACRQLRRWRDQGWDLGLAVNVSALQFRKQNLKELINEVMEEYHLEASWLELEITESLLIHNGHNPTPMLLALRDQGLRIALDDFGTGYSSLSYLKRYPINCLKIDRSFISDIPSDKDDTAITQAIIGLAHHLQMQVVAEGIENAEQLAFLKSEGCDCGQGFFIQRPMPVGELEKLLESGTILPSAQGD